MFGLQGPAAQVEGRRGAITTPTFTRVARRAGGRGEAWRKREKGVWICG